MSVSEPEFLAESTDATPFRIAPVHGRFVFLRPVGPEDYGFLRAAELGGELGVRWRYRGSMVSPDQWSRNLWQSTLTQYLIVGTTNPSPLGLVVAYQANFQDGHAYLAAESFRARRPDPLMIFGISLFIEHVFTCWSFHKLYLEVAEYNLGQFGSALGRQFAVEGRLREHIWYGDRRWDQVLLALYRDAWRRDSNRILRAAQPVAETRMRVRVPAPVNGGSAV